MPYCSRPSCPASALRHGFVCLDVIFGKQFAGHHGDDRDPQFAPGQHSIVDRAQRNIDTEIVQQNRALTIQEHTVGILADQEADDNFIGKDRVGRDTYRRSRGYALLDAARAVKLLPHDANHNELNRLLVENFGHFVADDIGIATALAARALRIGTRDKFNDLRHHSNLPASLSDTIEPPCRLSR
jgi:hypothetical protein